MKVVGLHAPNSFHQGNQIRTLHSVRSKRKIYLPNSDCITDDALTDMVLNNRKSKLNQKQQIK